MKYLCLLSLFMLVLTSCYHDPKHIELADQQMSQFAKEVKKSDNLTLVGSGGGFLRGISKFSFTFFSPMPADIDSARRLYIDVSTRFLNRINDCEEIRCYLYDYPVTIHNLDLLIIFQPIVKKNTPNYVDSITMGENASDCKTHHLYYGQYDEVKDKSTIFFEESYLKAIEIIQQQP